MKCAVAIFAKTIGLSHVKTRLAADIGQDQAEAFYALSVKAIEAVASSASRKYGIRPHWAVGEAKAVNRAQWQSFPALWTGNGGLGERLATLSETLFETHDAVMFVGTDSPQLSPHIFDEAIAMLEENPGDCVVGPANDGGFYLFASKMPIPREVWEEVTYSVETTLADLKIRSGQNFHALKQEQDVDFVEDLASLQQNLARNKDELLIPQLELLAWLNNHFEVAV